MNDRLTVTFHNLYLGGWRKQDLFYPQEVTDWQVHMVSNIDGTWELTLQAEDIIIRPGYVLVSNGRRELPFAKSDYNSIEIH